MFRYQIEYHDDENGATSAWAVIEADGEYTAEDYEENIRENGDEDEKELLEHGYFIAERLPMTIAELLENYKSEMTEKAAWMAMLKHFPEHFTFDSVEEFNEYCEDEEEPRYRVNEDVYDSFDRFYGSTAETCYVEECQKNGIPKEDIAFMIREYGEDIVDLLEEI